MESEYAKTTLKVTVIFKICHNYYFFILLFYYFNLRFNVILKCALPDQDFIV